MSTCCFFGHKYINVDVKDSLRSCLIDLIMRCDVDKFYVGNQGQFDHVVWKTLMELSDEYSFQFATVLAYLPKPGDSSEQLTWDTVIPAGIEYVMPRFAISWRNKWMINQSDYVVTYISHDAGSGAAQFARLAERKQKIVINLYEGYEPSKLSEPKEPKEPTEPKEQTELSEPKEPTKPKKPRKPKEPKEPKEPNEPNEPKELKKPRKPKEPKKPKEPNEPSEPKA